jgi:hypothetical protein
MNYSKSILPLSSVRFSVIVTLLLSSSSLEAFQFSPLTSNNIYTLHAGNVGIGSNAPVYKLEVASASNAKLLVKSTASPNPAIIEIASPSSVAVVESITTPSIMTRIGSRTNHDVSFITNNVEKLVIKADGKVGIGKTPAFALDVNGAVNATSINLGGQPLTITQWINNGSNINFSAGMVSIGTTRTPLGYKLAVGGKIISEEVVVRIQANWPDYVFASDYKLPPLSEIAKFVKQHKHLPNFPVAEEVSVNGVAIGELNVALVQKVEELTLYLIEQEKRIQALEKFVTQR